MEEELKGTLRQSLLGLRETIAQARRTGRNCHYNVGQALEYLRDKTVGALSETQRGLAESTIRPVTFTVPRGGDLGVWTVDSVEAFRLFSQLDQLLATTHPVAEEYAVSRKAEADSPNDKVFLVHGHDEAARESVARFLEKLGLHAVILHEQANAGGTVIEKLEANAGVRFAVVLLTPDDEGGVVGKSELKKRARQNVVLELGYFLGALGRRNVCALHKSSIEMPSDYLGVVFVQFDESGGWKLQLAREMKAAGLRIDMNNAI